MIERADVDRIMDAVNIVDVVSEFVHLRKAGINYKGLCPFHDDTTPSFIVSPAKGICHCFACGKGGNAVNFIMEHEQMTYPEALRWLARKYNIEIKERELSDEEKREASERESMFIVNEWAKDYFQDIIYNNVDGQAIGMQYFRSRGFRDDIIKKFQLGYALPQRNSLSTEALRKGYKAEFLVKTGLCYQRDNGELVDRYSGRVIFPWLNVSGKVNAFGGRLLDSRTKGVQQKYVNSPESDIYHKDHELYGLYQAKKAIVKEDSVYMVEGYTDVISMHQCGIENVVANSGTALSVYQIRLLHRFTSNIVLLYDGDEAGIHAAMRGTDMLLAEGMNVKVLLLPDGDDPDSFSRKHSADEFRQYVNDHQSDFILFKTKMLLDGVTDPIKRSEAISSIVKSVSVIPNQITRDTYLRECSSNFQMSEQTLINTMNSFIRTNLEEKAKEQEREMRRKERLDEQEYERQRQEQMQMDEQQRLAEIAEEELEREQRIMETAQPPADSGNQAIPKDDSAKVVAPLQYPQKYPQNNPPVTIGLHSVSEQIAEVEKLLVQVIIRHGDERVFNDLENENGELVSLSVSQYIDYDLGSDGLLFHDELYNKILMEAVEHNDEEGFKSETYFTSHPDIRISRLAGLLAINRYQLSKSLEMEDKPETLRQKVEHLICDFRKKVIEQRMKEIQMRLRGAGSDMAQIRELMTEYNETQQLRNALAKRLGNDVLI